MQMTGMTQEDREALGKMQDTPRQAIGSLEKTASFVNKVGNQWGRPPRSGLSGSGEKQVLYNRVSRWLRRTTNPGHLHIVRNQIVFKILQLRAAGW